MKSKSEIIERLKTEAEQAENGQARESKYGPDANTERFREKAAAKRDVLVWVLGSDCPKKYMM